MPYLGLAPTGAPTAFAQTMVPLAVAMILVALAGPTPGRGDATWRHQRPGYWSPACEAGDGNRIRAVSLGIVVPGL